MEKLIDKLVMEKDGKEKIVDLASVKKFLEGEGWKEKKAPKKDK